MKKCESCSKEITNRNKFCNNTCQQEYQTNLLISRWLGGENITRKGGTSIPTWMRKYLLEEADYKCTTCGWGELNKYTNTIPLDIDHVDGNAYNNKKQNLKVECPNCHSLKKTFKNTGNRKSARKYRNR
jgi:rubredoxin